jgi:hypothetical protein
MTCFSLTTLRCVCVYKHVCVCVSVCLCVCVCVSVCTVVDITAVPNTKLCAWGEEDSGEHVL